LAATSKCPQCVALLLDSGAVSTVEVKNEVWKNCHLTCNILIYSACTESGATQAMKTNKMEELKL